MARVLWVLVLALLAALVVYGMRRGWVNRARRQASRLAEFPEMPGDLDEQDLLLPSAEGLYVGSTRADDWQDRIVVGDVGHRAAATACLWSRGLLLRRSGASPLWIPAESLVEARVDHKLANKVVPGAGLLIVTWRLGEQRLDTGFRAEDTTTQPRWAEAVRALVPGGEPTRHEETAGTRQEET